MGLLRGFIAGYGAKATLNALFALIAKRSLAAAGKQFRGEDAVRFGAFLAGLVGVTNGLRCLLSHVRGTDDRLNAAIAGLDSSF